VVIKCRSWGKKRVEDWRQGDDPETEEKEDRVLLGLWVNLPRLNYVRERRTFYEERDPETKKEKDCPV